MDPITQSINFIINLDEIVFYKFFLIFLSVFFIMFGSIIYLHHRRSKKYFLMLQQINKERTITKRILSDYQLVTQQKDKVDEILDQDKNFFIAQAYSDIVKKMGLTSHQPEDPVHNQGPTISNKTERTISANLDKVSMKNLVDLLSAIAEIERLYPKELTIIKTPNTQAIDIDLTIATLEST